jgi:hypothetical protein
MWKPKVGILVNYSEGNVAFPKQEGFTSIGFWAQANGNLSKLADPAVSQIRQVAQKSGAVVATDRSVSELRVRRGFQVSRE